MRFKAKSYDGKEEYFTWARRIGQAYLNFRQFPNSSDIDLQSIVEAPEDSSPEEMEH